MNINTAKLEVAIDTLAKDVNHICTDSSVFIGEINGKPIMLTVMSNAEAVDTHDYDGVGEEFCCVSKN